LFGADVAARVGRVWGINPQTQELNSVFNRTGQRGLWFIAGSFAQCRIMSKYLALQVKATEAGIAASL
jgi:putative flavoprotein involved in K+ transport